MQLNRFFYVFLNKTIKTIPQHIQVIEHSHILIFRHNFQPPSSNFRDPSSHLLKAFGTRKYFLFLKYTHPKMVRSYKV